MNNKGYPATPFNTNLQLTETIIQKDVDTDADFKPCNCEKSQCLKLYCECFAKNMICRKQCNCRDCKNNNTYEVG